jgi:glycosyltransferase involved in cell wall biosynthesis
MELYAPSGRRRLWPPVRFGLGVLAHLRRHGGDYDVVHTASFPYFSVLAARAAQRRHDFRLLVDWHEVWTRAYWGDYLGAFAGWIGWGVQSACLRVPQEAFCFSQLHAARLRDAGVAGDVTRLEGQYVGRAETPREPRPVAVFAGRHIPEKRVPALVAALARIPELKGEIYGDGPEREDVLAAIDREGLKGRVVAPGFVDAAVLQEALATACCFVLPSQREGYGLAVVESAARGVPSVVVAGPDNAAVELVEEGVNGTVAPSSAPDDLTAAIVRARAGAQPLRASTAEWFRRNADRLSFDSSYARVLEKYQRG